MTDPTRTAVAEPMSAEAIAALPWTPVESSHVVAVAFVENGKHNEEDEPLGDLFVEYVNNASYRYGDVAKPEADRVVGAESVGRAMHRIVKGSYDYARIVAQEEQEG